MAVQRAMLERDAELPEDRRIRYRIGINLGDVIVDGDDHLRRRRQRRRPDRGLVRARRRLAVAQRLQPGQGQAGRSASRPAGCTRSRTSARRSRPSAWRWTAWRRRSRPATARLPLASPGADRGLRGCSPWCSPAACWRFWPAEPPPEKPAIAVLPFDNYGGDEATGRLADGHHRGHHHRPRPLSRAGRDRPQLHRGLQGQAGRRPPGRAGTSASGTCLRARSSATATVSGSPRS